MKLIQNQCIDITIIITIDNYIKKRKLIDTLSKLQNVFTYNQLFLIELIKFTYGKSVL
jgi:hypothetical protein